MGTRVLIATSNHAIIELLICSITFQWREAILYIEEDCATALLASAMQSSAVH